MGVGEREETAGGVFSSALSASEASGGVKVINLKEGRLRA